MVLDFFRGTSHSPIEDVEETIVQMLRDGREVYDTATEAVFGGGFCTFSEPDRYFSYRRDGVTGRMASLILLR